MNPRPERHVLERQPLRYAEVRRSSYWFGQRKPANSNAAEASHAFGRVTDLFGGPVYGLAIASRSEVRGVRLRIDAGNVSGVDIGETGSPWLELVEGSPLEISLAGEERLTLDRLDAHDGKLVIVAALTPAAVYSLPVDISPVSIVSLGEEELSPAGEVIGEANERVYLAPPRATGGSTRYASSALRVDGGAMDVEVHRVFRDPHTGDVIWSEEVGAAEPHADGVVTSIVARDLEGCGHAFFRFVQGADVVLQSGQLNIF